MVSYYNIFPFILQTLMHKDVHTDDIIVNKGFNEMEYNFSHSLNAIEHGMLYTYINSITMCESKRKYLYIKYNRIIENLDNVHLTTETKTIFLNMISHSQRAYYGFIRFANLYKNKSRRPIVTTSLCGDELDEKSPSVISLHHEGNKYLFSVYELKNMIVKNLSNSSDFFPEPLPTKNPYNNIELLPSDIYNIYFHMVWKHMIIPPIISGYYKAELDLLDFEFENEAIMREVSIKNRLYSSHISELYPDVTEMLEYYNDTRFKELYIDSAFPRNKLISIMKPYLGLFYDYKYSYLRSKRDRSNKILGDKLKAFINFNPDFGKKIENDNQDIHFNEGHINFYDNHQTALYLRSPRSRRRGETATFNSMVNRIRDDFEEQGIINNRRRTRRTSEMRLTSFDSDGQSESNIIIDAIENNSEYDDDTDSTGSSLGMPDLIQDVDSTGMDTSDINNSLTDSSLNSIEEPMPLITHNQSTLEISRHNPFYSILNNQQLSSRPNSEEMDSPTYRVNIPPNSPIRINNRMNYENVVNNHNISPTLLNILTGIITTSGTCQNCEATFVRGPNEVPNDRTYYYCINCAEDVIPSVDNSSNIYIRPPVRDISPPPISLRAVNYNRNDISQPVLRRSSANEDLLNSFNVVREYSNNIGENTLTEEEVTNSSILISHTNDEEPQLIVHTPTRLTFEDDDDGDICNYNEGLGSVDAQYQNLPRVTQRAFQEIFLQPLGGNNYDRVPSPMSIVADVSDQEENDYYTDDDIEEDDLFDD